MAARKPRNEKPSVEKLFEELDALLDEQFLEDLKPALDRVRKAHGFED